MSLKARCCSILFVVDIMFTSLVSYCDPPKWACGGQGYGYCINAEDICDGHVDCQDQSDEINCGKKSTFFREFSLLWSMIVFGSFP